MLKPFLLKLAACVALILSCSPALMAENQSPPLQALVETERAFARRTRAIGQRDAFLEFFAPDALVFAPGPTKARERLEKRPSLPFEERQLTWEPRGGDAAASGDLGWLTGPATLYMPKAEDPGPFHENYLSVWRRQSDGSWKVILDVGVGTPQPVSFPEGFHPAVEGSRYGGPPSDKQDDLIAVDRELNAEIAAKGAADAFRERLVARSRLHRDSEMPVEGAQAIVQWLEKHPEKTVASTIAGESAASNDLGYTYGSYAVGGQGAIAGYYTRVWSRTDRGRWVVMVDVAAPVPES